MENDTQLDNSPAGSDAATDLKQNLVEIKDAASSTAQDFTEAATEKVSDALDTGTEALAAAKTTLADVIGSFRAFVVAHPYAVFAAGLAFGLLMKSRSRRNG